MCQLSRLEYSKLVGEFDGKQKNTMISDSAAARTLDITGGQCYQRKYSDSILMGPRPKDRARHHRYLKKINWSENITRTGPNRGP